MNGDTIAAIATGPAAGAIGIIRLSGPDAPAAAEKVFVPKKGKLSAVSDRMLVFGRIVDAEGRTLDHAMCVRMRAPCSYTGEDMAELHCHGGTLLLQSVMRQLFLAGVRQAEPGEFTRRAFLNGKMDLSEAEAVADLLSARSGEAVYNAAAQLGGSLSGTIGRIRGLLVDFCAHCTAWIDYTEEGVEPPDLRGAEDKLRDTANELRALYDTHSTGAAVQEGITAAIVGKPNVGKSSLLNALSGLDRSIVTDAAGTTRDVIEQPAALGGLPLRLLDTAGIRSAGDEAERMGVERAERAAREASLVIAVYDGSRQTDGDDRRVAALRGRDASIAVINKCDLPQVPDADALARDCDAVCHVSAKTGEGLASIGEAVRKLYIRGGIAFDGDAVTRPRQADALRRAAEACVRAADALREGMTPDIAWVDAESAADALGEITGEKLDAELLDRVFERFCVGK